LVLADGLLSEALEFGRRAMSDLEIYTVDDPRQLAVLRSKSRKVQAVTPSLVALAQEMLETMRNANGVGLAAPQIGVTQRLFVAELPEDEEANQPQLTVILFNPEIIKGRGEQVGFEGCLSICLDEMGKAVRHRVEGYLARVFQHEIDHLDGILYTDRLTDPETFQPVEVGQEEALEMQAASETKAAAKPQAALA
jgi:peptide deformylase